jgi:hypothetical protein
MVCMGQPSIWALVMLPFLVALIALSVFGGFSAALPLPV